MSYSRLNNKRDLIPVLLTLPTTIPITSSGAIPRRLQLHFNILSLQTTQPSNILDNTESFLTLSIHVFKTDITKSNKTLVFDQNLLTTFSARKTRVSRF